MTEPFEGLPRGHFGVILADPPWRFETWGDQSNSAVKHASAHYPTLSTKEIADLPVQLVAADSCVLLMWISWPFLRDALWIIENWRFTYKTCGFCWIKADTSNLDLFAGSKPQMGSGYWTRANSEVCLLATKGKPKRLNADIRQAIVEPRREHSRKPDCVHERIERLVAGPYLELFARQRRPGWTSWGNETDKFTAPAPTPEWDEMWSRKFDYPERI